LAAVAHCAVCTRIGIVFDAEPLPPPPLPPPPLPPQLETSMLAEVLEAA
jgi:hypothetical protein